MKPIPPMLRGAPVFGSLFEFALRRETLIRRGYESFGPVFGFELASQPVAALIGPEYHQFFFTETDRRLNIEKPYRQLAAIFGKVGFLAPKEVYQDQHPVLYAPFKPSKMPEYVAVMQREVQRWLDSLGDSGSIDIGVEMVKLVQTVAGCALMGDDFQQRTGREFWQQFATLGKALNPAIPPEWPVPRNIRRDKAKARIREMLRPIISERRRNPERYDDFFQQLVSTPRRSGALADDDVLVGLVQGLMFAGHETTAGQAAWTVIELARTPDYLALVRGELEQHLPPDTPLTAQTMRKLEHVFWAVREVERLHPTGDGLMRMVEQEVELGGYRIPPGWLVTVSARVAHKLPELFSDPERFDPLRFAPGREEDRKHGYTLIGFGGGKHKCAGMSFANNEMMVIAALLLQQFDLELLTPEPRDTFALGAARPDKVVLRYRRRPAAVREPALAGVASV